MEIAIKEKVQDLLPPSDSAVEIQKLEKELVKERDRTLRTLADFTNYRRRIERDSKKLSEEGKREVIFSLLDIIDDMEKALHYSGEGEHRIVKGVQNIHRKFLLLLESQGVVPIDCVGTPFSPEFHEAVAMTKNEAIKPGIIVNELRRGYLWKKELLRAAQVHVAE